MKIFIRTDASPALGAGHLMRCLALADELRRRGAEVAFVTRAARKPWQELIEAQGHRVLTLDEGFPGEARDAEETRRAVSGTRCDWLVVDHYGLGRAWEAAMRADAAKILAIDDLRRMHDCDALLDQNVVEDTGAYEGCVPAGCARWLGPRYALLRPEFVRARAPASDRDRPCRRVFINFGGSDPTAETEKAIQAFLCADLPEARAEVVLGAANDHADELLQRYGSQPRLALQRHADGMAALMAGADLAIGAGGISTWERACLGLPSIVIAVADNQAGIAEELAARGNHCYLGRSGDVDAEDMTAALVLLARNRWLRTAFARTGLALCDGLGAARVAGRLVGASALALRRATAADGATLLAWRNAEEIRRCSGDAGPIARADHERWLASVLADERRLLLIGEDAAGAVGVVRFDVAGERAEISIYLVPERIGSGLGAVLLAAAEARLSAELPQVREIGARVLGGNVRSAAMFEAAGYSLFASEYRKPITVRTTP